MALPTAHLLPAPPAATEPAVVLLLPGSLSPITHMHLRLLEIARDHVRARGRCVRGAYVSPAADAYAKPGLAPARHRVAMARLALRDAPWAAVDAWEAAQGRFVRTWEVARRIRRAVRGKVDVRVVCGADLVRGMEGPAWTEQSLAALLAEAGLLWVARGEGDAVGERLRALGGVCEEMTGVVWDLSSSAVRGCVQRGESIMYMTPTPVVSYIEAHGLFK